MFGKNKASPAHSSGMRGREAMPPALAEEEAAEGEHRPGESLEEQSMGNLVAQHVHGPDENGHHHLNLSTFAAAHQAKHGGLQK
jgi:hypothetical protein